MTTSEIAVTKRRERIKESELILESMQSMIIDKLLDKGLENNWICAYNFIDYK